MPRITIRETVRVWGHEQTTFDSDLTIDEIKAEIVKTGDADSIDTVEVYQIRDWLSDNLLYIESTFDAEEVLDRDNPTIITDGN